MPAVSDRYNKFLSTYDFYTNSIQFRIQSSLALEKWKNVQAFQLNQLVNGRFYFPYDRREILLLKYDLWSRWLYEIENLCIELCGEHYDNISTKEDIEIIINLAEKTAYKYNEIMLEDHTDKFDVQFVDIWLEQHCHISQYLLNTIRTYEGLTFDRLFTELVNLLVQVMQYTLTEIHELDILFCRHKGTCNEYDDENMSNRNESLINDDTPFIIVTELAEQLYKKTGLCLVCKRLETYKNYFKINEIYLKNYTDEFISSDLIERIEDMGIVINYKKCLIKN